MNGEFEKWSEKALLIMSESEKINKAEHKQIISMIKSLHISFRRVGLMSIAFLIIATLIVIWEIIEFTTIFK